MLTCIRKISTQSFSEKSKEIMAMPVDSSIFIHNVFQHPVTTFTITTRAVACMVYVQFKRNK